MKSKKNNYSLNPFPLRMCSICNNKFFIIKGRKEGEVDRECCPFCMANVLEDIYKFLDQILPKKYN